MYPEDDLVTSFPFLASSFEEQTPKRSYWFYETYYLGNQLYALHETLLSRILPNFNSSQEVYSTVYSLCSLVTWCEFCVNLAVIILFITILFRGFHLKICFLRFFWKWRISCIIVLCVPLKCYYVVSNYSYILRTSFSTEETNIE